MGQGSFRDHEDQFDFAGSDFLSDRNNRDIVISGLFIKFLDPENILVNLVAVVKGCRKNGQLLAKIGIGLVVVSDKGDFFDCGALFDREGQGDPPLESPGKDLNLIEIAGLVKGFEICGDSRTRKWVPHLAVDFLTDGRRIDFPVSHDVDPGNQNGGKILLWRIRRSLGQDGRKRLQEKEKTVAKNRERTEQTGQNFRKRPDLLDLCEGEAGPTFRQCKRPIRRTIWKTQKESCQTDWGV